MKVRVTFTLEVNPEAWRDNFGCDDVRADVKQSCESAANDYLKLIGAHAPENERGNDGH